MCSILPGIIFIQYRDTNAQFYFTCRATTEVIPSADKAFALEYRVHEILPPRPPKTKALIKSDGRRERKSPLAVIIYGVQSFVAKKVLVISIAPQNKKSASQERINIFLCTLFFLLLFNAQTFRWQMSLP